MTGTYSRFDINNRVSIILRDYKYLPHCKLSKKPCHGYSKKLFEYHHTRDIKHCTGFHSYTASVQRGSLKIYSSTMGNNCFWETGYVGAWKGLPYYSSKENARRAVSLTVLVEYYSFIYEICPPALRWTDNVMSKSSNNYVVLFENRGNNRSDYLLFCILLNHSSRYTLLIPRTRD